MMRVESGSLQVQKEWQLLSDVVGLALIRTEEQLRDHPVTTDFPPDLPLAPVDEVLLEQVFVNLLENAAKYTPPGTPIEIGAEARGDRRSSCRSPIAGRDFPQARRSASSRSSTARAAARRRRRPGTHHLPRHRDRARRTNLGREPPRWRSGVSVHHPDHRHTPDYRRGSGGGRQWTARPSCCWSRTSRRCGGSSARRSLHDYRLIEAGTARKGSRTRPHATPTSSCSTWGCRTGDGLDVTRDLREWSTTPIIVLSARGASRTRWPRSTWARTTT